MAKNLERRRNCAGDRKWPYLRKTKHRRDENCSLANRAPIDALNKEKDEELISIWIYFVSLSSFCVLFFPRFKILYRRIQPEIIYKSHINLIYLNWKDYREWIKIYEWKRNWPIKFKMNVLDSSSKIYSTETQDI